MASQSRQSSPSRAVSARTHGPFDGAPTHGVTHDGQHLWIATGATLDALDTDSGKIVRSLPVASDAGTAFDGRHLYQLTDAQIQKIDAQTGEVLGAIPAPGGGRDSGLTWAEGALWVGQYRDRKIHRVDPETGAITRTIESDRFVTGVSWARGQLWHATGEGDPSELRRVDPESGEILERVSAPEGLFISGLTHVGDRFFCGSGKAGRVHELQVPGAAPGGRADSALPSPARRAQDPKDGPA